MAEKTPHETLAQAVLDARKAECTQWDDAGKLLDTRAQANVAIASVFLAGVFAILREPAHSRAQAALFAGTVVLLSCSVLFSTLSLRVRTLEMASIGDNIEKFANDLWPRSDEQFVSALPNFISDQARIWEHRERRLAALIAKKADYLKIAQWTMFCGIVAAAVMAITYNLSL